MIYRVLEACCRGLFFGGSAGHARAGRRLPSLSEEGSALVHLSGTVPERHLLGSC